MYHWQLSMASFRFCETRLLHIKRKTHQTFVVNKSAIFPFLGGKWTRIPGPRNTCRGEHLQVWNPKREGWGLLYCVLVCYAATQLATQLQQRLVCPWKIDVWTAGNFLTFVGSIPIIYCQKTSFVHLRATESPKDVFSTPLCHEHPLWNLELFIR